MLYDLPAPAKINLFLHVVGRRPDGYHLLQTVFRFIDLQDTLDIDLRRDGQISRETNLDGVEPEQDLVVKAARLLQQSTASSHGAHIRVRKSIPSGAGLGGGSSDAATVLIALNRLWKTGLSRQQLMEIGLKLGADVPVFLFGRNAFAEGVGEELTAIPLESCGYLIVQPCQAVPTAGIFQHPGLTRDTKPVTIMDFSGRQGFVSPQSLVTSRFIAEKSLPDFPNGFGRNDLQPVVLDLYPDIRRAVEWLQSCGVHARMTGSGSCFFVACSTKDNAQRLSQELIAKMHVNFASVSGPSSPIRAFYACDGLPQHPLLHWIAS